jgi:hypothetical protein
MDRRDFLATGAALAIGVAGGCTGCARGPEVSLEMESVSDAEIARRVTHPLEAAEDSDRYRLVADAVENGTATETGTEPLFPADGPFVYDGAVYRLDREVTASKPATEFFVTLDPAEGSADESATVRYGDLPAVDRGTFERRGWDDGGVLGFGTSLLYLESEIPDSALVPEPERPVIVWDAGAKGRFQVDGSRETALRTYRYAAEEVHPSAERYGRDVRERHAFALSGLSDGERDIVERARAGSEGEDGARGYAVSPGEAIPRAAWDLADRFRGREEVRRAWEDDGSVDASASGTYLVRYGDEVYWTRLYLDRDETARSSATAER